MTALDINACMITPPMRFVLRAALTGLVVALLHAPPVAAAPPEGTGLPLPRFVSLRGAEVNMRTGPGMRYPVEWVFQRRGLPMEVIAEYRAWRRVRGPEGAEGWVHRSLLDGRRMVIVTGQMRTLHSRPDMASLPVARAEAGVVGRVDSCAAGDFWCRVEIQGVSGWLRRDEIWGVYAEEAIE